MIYIYIYILQYIYIHIYIYIQYYIYIYTTLYLYIYIYQENCCSSGNYGWNHAFLLHDDRGKAAVIFYSTKSLNSWSTYLCLNNLPESMAYFGIDTSSGPRLGGVQVTGWLRVPKLICNMPAPACVADIIQRIQKRVLKP